MPGQETPITSLQQRLSDKSTVESQVRAQARLDYLTSHFENQVLQRFHMPSGRLQVTIDLNNEALRNSILAVASAHCCRTTPPNPNYMSSIEEQSREHALHSLREHLGSAKCVGGNTTLMINIFVANILLAILDGIIDTQRTHPRLGIVPYVRGGRTILIEWQILDQIFRNKEDLSLPTLSIFATMDLTYSLLGGQEPYFPSSIWEKFVGCQSWWGPLVAGHPFLQIMTILSQLAQLGHQAYNEYAAPSQERLSSIIAQLEQNHRALDWLRPSCFSGIVSPPLSSRSYGESWSDSQSWAIFCAAYHHTALIYIYRALYNYGITHEQVQQETHAGLEQICRLSSEDKHLDHLLFPILVIGAHCRKEEQQSAVLWALWRPRMCLQYSSIEVMQQFLQWTWGKPDHDLDWWGSFRSIWWRILFF
ncbi:hypothetical protein Plec18167_006151 [Paecilomyces lecythidis]|uniref:Fungal-specific transcription factor domain-containing protein n=1 Tax=Paecilomyces lecythidis TaxID=3004212 RepID=A0ABR3XDD6_9EURO